jgi:subtilase family serine protease
VNVAPLLLKIPERKSAPERDHIVKTVIYLICVLGGVVYGQPSGHPAPMIRDAVDAARQVRLAGNTRPEATAANDRGQVADDFKLDHMLLHLKRSPEREAAAIKYIDEMHDATSPNFHKWLTPDQFAEHFGVAKQDVDAVTSWLKSQGFTIHGVPASGLLIDFSGTAAQVRGAYHTEIHNLEVNGKKHFANMSDPQIPAALAPAVSGIVSLHNFYPRPQNVRKAKPAYDNATVGNHDIVPGDLAAIYNLNPLFAAGITGKGQSVMVLEDTYLYSTGDWTIFRKTFGLTRPYPFGSLSQVSPAGALTCENPGFQGNPSDPGYEDDSEAAIDVDWATAAAPNAAIILAACTDTTAFGAFIALENTLNGPVANLPSSVSLSFEDPESDRGTAGNAFISNLYQQAVMEGVSVFVASGDGLSAAFRGAGPTTDGIQVNALASTPYNVAVGGTDFGYNPNGVSPSTYWGSTNSNTYASALSYIQEIPWNDSCASSLVASFFANSDPLTYCNSGTSLVNTIGGAGGPSGCATGSAGTCAGYPKPSYQHGVFGNPTDGVRDIPDVSLFAGNGFWAASYIICWSNPNGGSPCTGAPSTWAERGGTSVSSPIMAGIQALVNQKTGSQWGNPNVTLYALANAEYGASGSSACNSNTVNKTANSCIFYDITQGDIDAPCKAGSPNCFATGKDAIGILSTSTSVSQPAYPATPGWDFSSGLGSVNVFNLVMNWPMPRH